MTAFRIRAPDAALVELCLFDDADGETRLAMARDGDEWVLDLPEAAPGTRYGLRAHGAFDPEQGLRFDPAKLLVDPAAVELDRAFAFHPDLATLGADTAALVPKGVVPAPLPDVAPAAPCFARGRGARRPDL
jgi:glycogen operon protein